MLEAMRSLLNMDIVLCCTPITVPYVGSFEYYMGEPASDASHAAEPVAEGTTQVLTLHPSYVYLASPNITLGLFTSIDDRVPPVAVAVVGQGITLSSLPLVVAKVDEADKDATWIEAACQDYAVRVTEKRQRVDWFIPLSAVEGITTQA